MRRLIPFLLALPAFAAITNVQVQGVTATQAVVSYTSSTQAACSWVVSESATLSPVVHDVDASLFTGANLDSRTGSLSYGAARTFVVGQRLSAQGLDGNFYSRALQANTPHTFQITCGSDTYTGTFTTANVPLGDTSVEQPPFNSAAPFNYAWPTINLSDKTKTYVDPQTGVLLKRMTGPGDWNSGESSSAVLFSTVFDPNSAWTNPLNANSGSTSTLATYSGAASDPLLLPFPTSWNPNFTLWGWATAVGVDDFQVTAYGDGSDASAANRTVSVCWAIAGTCYTGSIDLVLPQTTPGSISTGSFPNSTASEWGVYPSPGFFLPRGGTVNVSGTAVTWGSYSEQQEFFNVDRPAGSKLYIAGSSPACVNNFCTIASVQSYAALTIVENPGTLTGATYWDAAPGLKAWKKTATGTVNVAFSFKAAFSGEWTMDGGGEFDSCGHNPVTISVDASGNPISPSVTGYLCMARTAQYSRGGSLYVIIPSTGESRLLSSFNGPVNIGDPVADRLIGDRWLGGLKFDPNNSTILYHSSEVNGTTGSHAQSIFKIQYTGNFAAWVPVYSGTQPTDYMTYTNLTPASTGMDILSQVQAAIPGYNSTFYGTFINNDGLGMAGKYYVLNGGPGGGQDAPCAFFFFDTSTTPASFVKKADSFTAPTLRWGGCHTTNLAGFGDYAMLLAKQMADSPTSSVAFLGPWQMTVQQVMQNGSWTSNTAIAANYCDSCPANAYGATCCETIKTQGEPCSRTPAAAELAAYPCPYNAAYSTLLGQTIAVGDWIVDGAHYSTDGERLRVLSKTVNGDNSLTLTLQRGVGPCVGTVATLNGWTAWMAVNNGTCRINTFFGSGSDLTNTWVAENSTLVNSHNDIGAAPTVGNISVMGSGQSAPTYFGYEIRYNKPVSDIGNAPDYAIYNGVAFAANRVGTESGLQQYPSLKQWDIAHWSDPGAGNWGLDTNALLPSTGSGDEYATGLLSGTSTPVGGLTQTYTTPILGGGAVNIKTTPLLGYAGPYLLQDISGPSSSIADANSWSYCYAYKAGECRAGSTAGTVYTNVPIAGPLDGCYVNTFAVRAPCVFMASANTSQVLQWDISRADPLGVNWRRITMGLSGWGRQYDYANARSLPDGSWAIMRGYWLNGQRGDLLLAKLPPWPAGSSVNRATFQPFPLQVGSVPAGTDHITVTFGYTPAMQCTSRQEQCVAATSTFSESSPFSFAQSDTYTGVPCASGPCTVVLAVQPQRVVYYQPAYWASGAVVATGNVQVAVVP